MASFTVPARELTITAEPAGERLVLRLQGEFDMPCVGEFNRAAAAAAPGQTLAIDLSDVSFLDSSAIAALIAAHKRRAGAFVLQGTLQPTVSTVFEIVGLADYFARA